MPTPEQYQDFYKNPGKYMSPKELQNWRDYNKEFEWRQYQFFPNPDDMQMDNKKLWDEWDREKEALRKKFGIKAIEDYISPPPIEIDKDKEPVPPGTPIVKKSRDLELKILGYV